MQCKMVQNDLFALTSVLKKDSESTIRNTERNNEGHSLWWKINIYCVVNLCICSRPESAQRFFFLFNVAPNLKYLSLEICD